MVQTMLVSENSEQSVLLGNMTTLLIHVPLFKTSYAKTILDLESGSFNE